MSPNPVEKDLDFPKSKPLPKLDHAEAAATIRREWRRPDGTPIPAADADHRASVFLHHLRHEPGPGIGCRRG
jgi:hypothetical protein